jgi:hypothetical protein
MMGMPTPRFTPRTARRVCNAHARSEHGATFSSPLSRGSILAGRFDYQHEPMTTGGEMVVPHVEVRHLRRNVGWIWETRNGKTALDTNEFGNGSKKETEFSTAETRFRLVLLCRCRLTVNYQLLIVVLSNVHIQGQGVPTPP